MSRIRRSSWRRSHYHHWRNISRNRTANAAKNSSLESPTARTFRLNQFCFVAFHFLATITAELKVYVFDVSDEGINGRMCPERARIELAMRSYRVQAI